ncbi:MAG TPA: hypothetical protein VFS29_08235 [Motilibacteraceae bacterium]|nr:hypothetical protein [Motilibacteraceae bacterium]
MTHATERDGAPTADDGLPDAGMETGMDTGSEEGTPGEREPVDPADAVAVAVQDDAPLPPEVAGRRAGVGGADGAGGPSGDGLDPAFTHP